MEPEGVGHSVGQLNDHLGSYGLPPLALPPGTPDAAAAGAVHCLHDLLRRRQLQVAQKEEVAGALRRARADHERWQKQLQRAEERGRKAEAEVTAMRQQAAASERSRRQRRETLLAALHSLQQTNAQLLFREEQLGQRAAAREAEGRRLTGKVTALLREKAPEASAGHIEVLHGGLRGPRSSHPDPAGALQRRMAEAGERDLEESQEERETLRNAIGAFHHQLACLLAGHTGHAVDMTSDDLPFFLHPEAIEDFFHSNCHLLDDAMRIRSRAPADHSNESAVGPPGEDTMDVG